MEFILGFLIGVAIGAAAVLAVSLIHRRQSERQLRETFSSLAAEALDANSRRLAEAAAGQLDGKKALIDQAVAGVGERLELLRQFLQRTDAQRQNELGRLTSSISTLSTTTSELHKVLASTQRRGAWGERMAEDVLRLAGLQESVNYLKQSSADAATGRADFTFLLPNGLKVNMDVKFPLENYKAYLDAVSDGDRATHAAALCAAVRAHIRDVAGRGYIDPAVPTVPYVILFIPSEQIFSLAISVDADLMDAALAQKVVLASPLTLYATLAIMRQAAENFNITKTAGEVIELLRVFSDQWIKYKEAMDMLGKRLEDARKEYDKLVTARTNMLERPLARIEDLRTSQTLLGEQKSSP